MECILKIKNFKRELKKQIKQAFIYINLSNYREIKRNFLDILFEYGVKFFRLIKFLLNGKKKLISFIK